MKDNIYTAIDKQISNGKIRIIYAKRNDNSQTKYIKFKGEYIVYYDKKDYYLITCKNIHTYKNNLKVYNNKNKRYYNADKIKLEQNPTLTIVYRKPQVPT